MSTATKEVELPPVEVKRREIMAAVRAEAESGPEVTIERDRYGYRIDGQFYRRVTTFCGGIPKPWLGSWVAKTVAEFAVEHMEQWQGLPKTDAVKLLKGSPWSKRDDAGDRGTAVHETAEAIVRGHGVPDGLNDDELACARAAEAFLKIRGGRVLASELTVFSPAHGYAGTLDLWEIGPDGDLWILDWKTSAGVYTEHAIQQAAYRNAEFAVVMKKPVKGKDEAWTGRRIPWGPERADRLGIVHVTPEGATLHPINYTKRLWTVFRAAAHVKLFQLDTDSFAGRTPREHVFLDPITPNEDDDS